MVGLSCIVSTAGFVLILRRSICLQLAGFANYVAYLGQGMFFLRRGERDGGVEACDADYGAVEIVEGFFVDDGGNFASQASGARVLVQDNDFVGFLHGLRNGFAIQRRDGAQVEDLDVDSVFIKNLGSF